MHHNIKKVYSEYMAKLILEELFPVHFNHVVMSDKPDLINYNGTGIEVTRASFPGFLEALSLFDRIAGKHERDINPRIIRQLERLESPIKVYNERVSMILPPAQWVSLNEVQKAFSDKLEKLQSYDNTSILFIYAPAENWFNKQLMQEFTDWMIEMQEDHVRIYSTVYIYEYTSIYVCSLHSGIVEQVYIDGQQKAKLVEKAVEYCKSL